MFSLSQPVLQEQPVRTRVDWLLTLAWYYFVPGTECSEQDAGSSLFTMQRIQALTDWCNWILCAVAFLFLFFSPLFSSSPPNETVVCIPMWSQFSQCHLDCYFCLLCVFPVLYSPASASMESTLDQSHLFLFLFRFFLLLTFSQTFSVSQWNTRGSSGEKGEENKMFHCVKWTLKLIKWQ